jgi:integrase
MAQYRILIPSEYEAIIDVIEKDRLRIVVETLANTGMRYSELARFSCCLGMFDAKNRAISLPAQYSKTKKERIIHLTPTFSKRLHQYLREHKSLEVPIRRSMDDNLIRWYLRIRPSNERRFSPSAKTFRKTWESWLLAAGYSSMAVALSQGHSELISYGHYANLDPRLKSEMEKVKIITDGWGT